MTQTSKLRGERKGESPQRITSKNPTKPRYNERQDMPASEIRAEIALSYGGLRRNSIITKRIRKERKECQQKGHTNSTVSVSSSKPSGDDGAFAVLDFIGDFQ
jgi:hypothetical protein